MDLRLPARGLRRPLTPRRRRFPRLRPEHVVDVEVEVELGGGVAVSGGGVVDRRRVRRRRRRAAAAAAVAAPTDAQRHGHDGQQHDRQQGAERQQHVDDGRRRQEADHRRGRQLERPGAVVAQPASHRPVPARRRRHRTSAASERQVTPAPRSAAA